MPGSKLKHCSWKDAAVNSRETASELHVWSARWPASTAMRLLLESMTSEQEDSALDGGSDAWRQVADLKTKELLDRRYERLQSYGRFTDTKAGK